MCDWRRSQLAACSYASTTSSGRRPRTPIEYPFSAAHARICAGETDEALDRRSDGALSCSAVIGTVVLVGGTLDAGKVAAGCKWVRSTSNTSGCTMRVPTSVALASLPPENVPSVTSIAVRRETLPTIRTPSSSARFSSRSRCASSHPVKATLSPTRSGSPCPQPSGSGESPALIRAARAASACLIVARTVLDGTASGRPGCAVRRVPPARRVRRRRHGVRGRGCTRDESPRHPQSWNVCDLLRVRRHSLVRGARGQKRRHRRRVSVSTKRTGRGDPSW